jgi:hypothetical protein
MGAGHALEDGVGSKGAPPPPGLWELLDPAYMAESLHEAMGPALVRKLWNLQKPTIAAVNGAAYGSENTAGISLDWDGSVPDACYPFASSR